MDGDYFATRYTSGSQGFHMDTGSTGIKHSSGDYFLTYSYSATPSDQWSLLTAVFDKSQSQLYQYVNGDLVASNGPSGSTTSDPAQKHLVVGGDYYTDTLIYMGGGFDDLVIFEKPMTALEVKDFYNSYSVAEPDKYASSQSGSQT